MCKIVSMERAQKQAVAKDLEEKMVLVSGPRQVGKTWLAKSLTTHWPGLYYLNFDYPPHKQIFIKSEWDRTAPLVVLDEIHKWGHWKTLLKGVFDAEGIPPRLLVTGSARLDVHRKGGDSLAGRYYHHRLLPFSVAELCSEMEPEEALNQLLRFGGFPEPLIKGNEVAARRWRRLYLERVIREDVRDFTQINEVEALALLVELLRERVGSPISYASLARDLQVSPHTVKRWVAVLESLYLVFRVTPFHRNIARAILKEPKIYFFDSGLVRGDRGAVLENVVAISLLKSACHREDVLGEEVRVHYIRDKEKREVDFVIVVDGRPAQLIEVKSSDATLAPALRRFAALLPDASAVQIVAKLKQAHTAGGIQIEPAASWLARLPT